MNEEKGFTLIEMMIVLLVITILLIITIPNISKHNSTINNKGCEALKKMVEAQVQAFSIEHQRLPESVDELISNGYLKEENSSCPNGEKITIDNNGKVL